MDSGAEVRPIALQQDPLGEKAKILKEEKRGGCCFRCIESI
jgi:hypothetical protein